jgi:hypothetical protein
MAKAGSIRRNGKGNDSMNNLSKRALIIRGVLAANSKFRSTGGEKCEER